MIADEADSAYWNQCVLRARKPACCQIDEAKLTTTLVVQTFDGSAAIALLWQLKPPDVRKGWVVEHTDR